MLNGEWYGCHTSMYSFVCFIYICSWYRCYIFVTPFHLVNQYVKVFIVFQLEHRVLPSMEKTTSNQLILPKFPIYPNVRELTGSRTKDNTIYHNYKELKAVNSTLGLTSLLDFLSRNASGVLLYKNSKQIWCSCTFSCITVMWNRENNL